MRLAGAAAGALRLAAPALFIAAHAGCTKQPGAPAAGPEFPTFTDVAKECNVSFQHENGFDGKHFRVVETVNGGLGLLDYNGDALLDIYFTNGRKLDEPASPPVDALYRQNADGSFTDVAREAGVADTFLSLGCAIADVDGDARPDIHVTNDGPDRLFRNNADATFTDIAARAGVALDGISSGSAFFDMERDGDLDLYVAQYVVDEKTGHEPCIVRGVPGYWPPLNYAAAAHHLFENRGDCSFVDVSGTSGIRNVEPGRGLGVLAADFNDDGLPDLYVANDMSANFMFLGDGKGHFVDAALANGTALSDEGKPLGSMGVDAADYDGDARLDLCVTNYQDQINNLYQAMDGGTFVEMAPYSGISNGRLAEVSWGVGFVDLENDGRRDLFIANGHLNPYTREMDESTAYEQAKKVFWNVGEGRFENVTSKAGECMSIPRVSRGTAFGDLDNDGDVDIVVMEAWGPPQILKNKGTGGQAWCLVELRGRGQNRDAIGARVIVTCGDLSQLGERRSSGSYLSVNDPRLHFGLGEASRIDRLEIRWPDGAMSSYCDLPVRRLIRINVGSKAPEIIDLAKQDKTRT